MGALMASYDWSRTPLGPSQNWPQSLKTAIGIMLTSRFAMWMAWGDGADLLLQRCLSADAGRKGRLGPGVALGPGLGGDLERDRAAHREPCCAVARPPGMKVSSFSSSAAATPRKPTTPSPIARCATTAAPSPVCCAWSRRRPNGSLASVAWGRCAIWRPRLSTAKTELDVGCRGSNAALVLNGPRPAVCADLPVPAR